MAQKVKKGDFVEIVYVGRESNTKTIFDLNDEEVAKKENLYNPNQKYEPSVVCVGKRDVIEGLDDALEGKEVGQKFKLVIPAKKAFGEVDRRLIQLVSLAKFKKEGMPFPGMQVNVNNMIGVVKTVSGGRVMIDFNHPLAGKEVEYEVEIKRVVTDDNEKLKSFFKMYLNMEPKLNIKNNKAEVEMDVPDNFKDQIVKSIKERVPSIKEVVFKNQPKKE
ncbi:peptidylprolyl isomerase [Candidatus Woesearchaeota archaeon]|nr:MAG: peptidylprolyl isomerase [Candidatus Woesearchaeota archaeon]